MKAYGKEFKEQAVKMAKEVGTKRAAENLGVNYHTLLSWRKKSAPARNSASPAKRCYAELSKEKRLEKKIAELEQTVDILKGAVSFFVNCQKK